MLQEFKLYLRGAQLFRRFSMSQVILQNKIQKDYSTFKTMVDNTLTEVTSQMLDGITKISTSAFLSYSLLINVEIPDSITTIENLVFNDCRLLRNIKIPNSVTTREMLCFLADFTNKC